MQNLLLRNACAHKTQGLSQRIEIKYGIYTKKSRKCGNKKVESIELTGTNLNIQNSITICPPLCLT